MKKLPFNSVRLLGKHITVTEVEVVPNAPQGAVGFNSCNDLTIMLLNKQAEDSKKDTMLHEVIHMLDYDYQLGLKEKQVHCMASGLYSFLRDNPKVAKWLLN